MTASSQSPVSKGLNSRKKQDLKCFPLLVIVSVLPPICRGLSSDKDHLILEVDILKCSKQW